MEAMNYRLPITTDTVHLLICLEAMNYRLPITTDTVHLAICLEAMNYRLPITTDTTCNLPGGNELWTANHN